jgi:hypothetical protein
MQKPPFIALVACLWGLSGTAFQQRLTPVPEGVWGGRGIQVTVRSADAVVDYGCDSGTISERLAADEDGRFAANGSHSFGRGGPRNEGEPPPAPRAARYEGSLKDGEMRLTVSLPELGRTVGEFTLRLGERPVLERCG